MDNVNAAQLLAVLSYAADMHPHGCHFHSWRMALVARRLASVLSPEDVQDVFYGALVQDIGSIGARSHIYHTPPSRNRVVDRCIANHAAISASMLQWLSGMDSSAEYVRSHHKWWRGKRRTDGDYAAMLTCTQILGLVDAASRAGCFAAPRRMGDGLRSIVWQANRAWKLEVWQALVQSTKDAAFYHRLADPHELHSMMTEAIADVGIPDALNKDEATTRALHLFAVSLDLKEPSAKGHTLRVADLAKSVAERMRLSQEEIELIHAAGLVHDCGKLGIPMSLLGKSGRYHSGDLNEIRPHAAMTIRALTCLPGNTWLKELAEIAGHDHERIDGRGYPHGLRGDQIPVMSRILAVVDAYDAMTAPSNYRIMTPKAAMMRLKEGAGKQFDIPIVDVVTSMVSSGHYTAKGSTAA